MASNCTLPVIYPLLANSTKLIQRRPKRPDSGHPLPVQPLGSKLIPVLIMTSNFSPVIVLHALVILDHFLKQTKNPFKKYFPHTDQRLIGVEPRVWK